jgi:hypothetical protein
VECSLIFEIGTRTVAAIFAKQQNMIYRSFQTVADKTAQKGKLKFVRVWDMKIHMMVED